MKYKKPKISISPRSVRFWLLFSATILAVLLASFTTTTAATRGAFPENQSVSIQYNLKTGDVLSYLQNLDLLISLVDKPEARFRVSLTWVVKTVVISASEEMVTLASQYNLQEKKIYGQEKLTNVLDPKEADNLLLPYQNLSPYFTRIFTVDRHGQVLDNSYNFIQSLSLINTLMTRIMAIPPISLNTGESYTLEEEGDELKVTFNGLLTRPPFELYSFVGGHPSGLVVYLFNRHYGVPDKLEYTARYRAAGQAREEKFSLLFLEKKRATAAELFADQEIRLALVKAALHNRGLHVPAELIRELLSCPYSELQTLASAICSLRGLPNGLDLRPFLKHKNPVVRFNLAKALYLYQNDSTLMKDLSQSSDSYLRFRARNFLENSDYVLTQNQKTILKMLRRWFYQKDESLSSELSRYPVQEIQRLLPALKPEPSYQAGFFKFFLSEKKEDRKRPFYLYLPDDYDPAEKFPLIIYLGMGEGRGDIALLSFYNAWQKENALAKYILVVPQAYGLWWDSQVEASLKKIWRAVFQKYSLDTNRIFLAGSSNGGIATYYYATTFPDRLAAIAENMGFPMLNRQDFDLSDNLGKLGNLLNSKIMISHGLEDEHITPEGDLKAYEYLKKNKAEVWFKGLKGKRHNVEPVEIISLIREIFDGSSRDPYPQKIKFVVTEPEYLQCYWVKIIEYENLPAEVQSTVKGNEIILSTNQVKSLRLYLDQALVDLSQPVTIKLNSHVVFAGYIHPSTDQLLLSTLEKADPAMAYSSFVDLKLEQ
ncbi:MAG: hypothetical protein H5U07_01325 [Candidatus Aminicenantes bacterium]|nr:hypothetical protein [Candidatus Aminicenantes bacterium]